MLTYGHDQSFTGILWKRHYAMGSNIPDKRYLYEKYEVCIGSVKSNLGNK